MSNRGLGDFEAFSNVTAQFFLCSVYVEAGREVLRFPNKSYLRMSCLKLSLYFLNFQRTYLKLKSLDSTGYSDIHFFRGVISRTFLVGR